MDDLEDDGLRLYRLAERDWEYYDASADFRRFLHWIDENFEDLAAELKKIRAENNWLHGEIDRMRVRGDY